MDEAEEITHEQLNEILADWTARGCATYLDDPALGFGYAATGLDGRGIPEFSSELPRIPVALVERHQAMWTHPGSPGPRQAVWTEQALHEGMQRIGHGVSKLPSLDGWLIAEWPDDGGGSSCSSRTATSSCTRCARSTRPGPPPPSSTARCWCCTVRRGRLKAQ